VSNIICSPKQLLKKIQEWKPKKYARAADKDRLIGILRRRKRNGKDTIFQHHGRLYAIPKLERYIRDQKLGDDDLNLLELSTHGT
jgi:hypothetical protein